MKKTEKTDRGKEFPQKQEENQEALVLQKPNSVFDGEHG